MGKRSKFDRVPRDFYPTPYEAFLPLVPHLPTRFQVVWEPCAGDGALIRHIERHFPKYQFMATDIEPKHPEIIQHDALTFYEPHLGPDLIITNPPWSREILHPMIKRFREIAPTWLLFDADWAYTKQACEFLPFCADIVAVGRVKWIPDSKMTGKDKCCWYRFDDMEAEETKFWGRT